MMLTSVNSRRSIMSELGIIDPWDAAAGGILSPSSASPISVSQRQLKGISGLGIVCVPCAGLMDHERD